MCGCEFSSQGDGPITTDPTPDPSGPAGPSDVGVDPPSDGPAVPLLSPTAIETVGDLPGDYYRPFALPGQISLLSLGELDAANDGDYDLFRSCGVPICVGEAGRYHAVAQNPAIGHAFLQLFAGGNPLVTDTYILDAAWRDSDDAIVALQMRRVLPGDIVGAPFLMFRIPDEEPAPPATPLVLDDAPAGDAGSIDDLPGVYVRPLPPYGEVGAVTLDEPAWVDGVATGSYRAATPYCLPWCLPEVGTYQLAVDSQTLGSGELRLVPSADPTRLRHYRVNAIWRNILGDVVALQLQRRTDSGLASLPFFLYRQWWTTTP